MIRDNGLISGLVVCLVLPSMASIWWSYCMEPSLRSLSDQPSARVQISGSLDTSAPVIPSRRKVHPPQQAVATVSVVGQTSAPETQNAILVRGADHDEANAEWLSPSDVQNDASSDVDQEAGVQPLD